MGKDPALLFYPNDYIGGTMGMTFEEKGAYMELLMLQFNRGHMTKHMIGQVIGQLWGQIEDKFIQDDKGLWYNERIDIEKEKRKAYVSSRKNNRLGVNQYSKSKKNKKGHMTSHMEDIDEDVIKKEKEELFENAWNLYDKKQDKTKALIVWMKLTIDDMHWCTDKIPLYVKSTPDVQFRKMFKTYLNNRSWENEIVLPIKEKKIVSIEYICTADPKHLETFEENTIYFHSCKICNAHMEVSKRNKE